MPERVRPSFAVVIPAHDEETVIARTLGFTAELEPGEAEVVVVANGCRDATALVAATAPGVRVIELPEAGKAAALNAGDRASTAYPRIYLDADIAIDAAALRRMRDALLDDAAPVCAPTVRFRTQGRPWAVRAFYRVYADLPYVRENLTGLGVYGVSEAGRKRFGRFPALTADDLFVQRHFSADERLVLDGDTFAVETPRTLAALVAVRTRTALGNAELAGFGGRAGDRERHARTGASTSRALLGLVRADPRLLPAAVVYTAVTAASRVRARIRTRGTEKGQWLRDGSTR